MNNSIAVLLAYCLQLLSTSAQYNDSQAIGCTSIKTGVFSYYSEQAGETIITRTEFIQREQNDRFGIITEDSVKWITDCKYKLIKYRTIKNESKVPMDVDMKFEIEIIEVKLTTYVQRITSNVDGVSIKSEITILK